MAPPKMKRRNRIVNASANGNANGSAKRKRSTTELLQWSNDNDVDLSSDDEENPNNSGRKKDNKSDDEDSEVERLRLETAEEKRLRIAQDYLQKLGEEQSDSVSNGDASDDSSNPTQRKTVDRLARRLENDRLASRGLLHREIASSIQKLDFIDNCLQPRYLSGHKGTVTCIALSGDDTTAFSGSKDDSVIKWDVETGARTFLLPQWKRTSKTNQAHLKEILAVAASTDGKYVAAGGREKLVHVWDCRTNQSVASFTGHRDAISCLAFRYDTLSLFSGSHDRSIKHWSLNEMGYIETLFGHQSQVNCIDAFRHERAVSGGRDNTVRLWKLAEETHLVFRPAFGGSIDAVACIDDDWFLSGGEDGALSLWNSMKKKPVKTVKNAHGPGKNGIAPWICSISAVKSSDLAVTGSSDGSVRLWQCSTNDKSLTQINNIPLKGFVNGLCISSSAKFLAVALGQEHRLGRWERIPNTQNRVCFVPLQSSEPA